MQNFLFPGGMLGFLLDSTAAIKSIPDGTDGTARTTVIASLGCTTPQALEPEEKERAGLGTKAKIFRSHSAVPGSTVTKRHRFICGGVDYRIRGITKVPATNPQYYEFLLEDEGIAG